MSKKYDLKVGEKYIDRATGEEKNRWTTIGAIIEKNGNFYGRINSIPVPWDGWFSLFAPRPKEGQQPQQPRSRQQQQQQQQTGLGGTGFEEFDDDIPF